MATAQVSPTSPILPNRAGGYSPKTKSRRKEEEVAHKALAGTQHNSSEMRGRKPCRSLSPIRPSTTKRINEISIPSLKPLTDNKSLNQEKEIKFSNGDIYIGGVMYKNNVCIIHGYGIFYFHSDDIYEGGFKDGQMHGYGVYSLSNGDIYEGGFKEGKMHGPGFYSCFADGTSYTGNFVENKREGEGVLRYTNGGQYSGSFSNNVPHGRGIYKLKGFYHHVEFNRGFLMNTHGID